MTAGPFIGRADERKRLSDVLDEAAAGRPGVALVGGDAGVGKSRLVAALSEEATRRGFLVLTGQCVDIAGGVPYLPFADALRAPAASAAAECLRHALVEQPALAPLVSGATPDESGGLGQLQLFGSFLWLLATMASEHRVLLVLEDLHWADRSSRDLFAFVARALRQEPVAVVATYRTDDLHRRHPLRPLLGELGRLPGVTRIDLAPFSPAETAEFLESRGTDVADSRLADVAARSQGNAFYAEELLNAAEHAVEGLPADLADVLLGRLERVDDTTRQLVRAAAVAGRRVHHGLLQRVAGLPLAAFEESLREALAQLLLVPVDDEAFAFRHALLQEAVYADLLPGERTRLHAGYADAIRADSSLGSPGELAHHSLACHDIPGAFAASVAAALAAERGAAPAEASGHYEQALALFDRVTDAEALAGVSRRRLALRAAAAAADSGEFSRAVTLTRALLAALDPQADPLFAAEVAERLSHYLLDSMGDHDSLSPGELAVSLVPAEPPTRLRARVLACLARNLVAHHLVDRALDTGNEAVAAAQAAGSPDDEADALVSLALVAEYQGRDADAIDLLQRARHLVARADNRPVELRVLYHLARVPYQVGALDQAAAHADEGVALAISSGLQWSAYGSDLLLLQYLVHFLAGHWDEASRLAASLDGSRIADSASARLAIVSSHAGVARGDSSARERLERSRCYEPQDAQAHYLASLLRGELALQDGDPLAARAEFGTALAAYDPHYPMHLATVRAAALATSAEAEIAAAARIRGDEPTAARAAAAATELLGRAERAIESGGGSGAAVGAEAHAWLAWAQAETARAAGSDDPARWAAAAEAFAYGDRYQVARCRWRQAEALLAAGRRDEARAALADARETATALGAKPLLLALDDLQRRGRLDPTTTPSVPAARSAGDSELTAREIEVLRLVADGLSNKQVGQRLFISTKTASVHVSNILAKLGATSRTEAAAIAHRDGLLIR